MAKVKTQLSEEDFKAWREFCKKEGKTGGKMIREFVREAIRNTDKKTISNSPKKREILSEQIGIRFTPREIKLIYQKTEEEGFEKATKWIRHHARRILCKEAISTDEEVSALRREMERLREMGLKLNQLARAMNIDFRESDKLSFKFIEEIRQQAIECKRKGDAIIEKNKKRWE